MSKRGWWMGMSGLLVALVGVWGVWVPHRVVALTLSGWDLTEFVKFLPDVAVVRECFYLPVWCVVIALGVMSGQRAEEMTRRRDRVWVIVQKTIAWLVALGLAVTILPPYPHLLNGYRLAEFRWRFVLGLGGCLWVLVSAVNRRWPSRVVGGALVGLALLGTVPALWQFWQVRDPTAAIYGTPLAWGWGIGALLLGWGLVGFVGVRSMLLRDVSSLSGGEHA